MTSLRTVTVFLSAAACLTILYFFPPPFLFSSIRLISSRLPLHVSVPHFADSGSGEHQDAAVKGFTRRIVAVGDLHGDMGNAEKVLTMAGVLDKSGQWSGDVDVFVQTGDIIDRGDDTIELFALMESIREQALASGQSVLTHLGNHEWMNVIGDWRYVLPTEIETFGSVAERQHALSGNGFLGRAWAANYTTASRLPLHPALGPPNTPYPTPSSETGEENAARPAPIPEALTHAAMSFVHGGLSPTTPLLAPFPTYINELSFSLLRKLYARDPQPRPSPPGRYPGLPADTTEEEEKLWVTDGPLWYRGWALKDEEEVCAEVDDVLQRTGTRRMVMGHTPDFERIVSRCDGKIIIIDTGISHAYGGALSALSVTYSLYPLPFEVPSEARNTDNRKEELRGIDSKDPVEDLQRWTEREVVTAVYLDHEEVLVDSEKEVWGDFAQWH